MRKSELLIVIQQHGEENQDNLQFCMRGNGKSATKGGNAAKNARKWQVSMLHYFPRKRI
jgi:hypothetical protein